MIITIDTSKDSKEDIQNLIMFLNGLVNGNLEYAQKSLEPEVNQEASDSFAQMFDMPEPQTQLTKTTEQPVKKTPRIMTYTY